MRFLNLSSDDKGFNSNQEDNQLCWETPFLNLNGSKQFAVVSLSLITKKWYKDTKLVTVKSDLVDSNYENPHGIVCVDPLRSKCVDYKASNLVYWNVDSMRPRSINFNFEGLEVKNILHVNIVICFC